MSLTKADLDQVTDLIDSKLANITKQLELLHSKLESLIW